MASTYNNILKPSKPQKKRLEYKWLADQQKCDLVFRSIYLSENVRDVCKDLGINFLTGRNIVQKYKKTGNYCTQPKASAECLGSSNARLITGDTNKKLSECPLGIILLDDSKMKLVASKSYCEEEETALIYLHVLFSNQCIV
eukprot:TRINITY_DN2505_c0_g2_i2.p1 TRINITY_DN2505_c0_g2~~TRINITY_DN2505_c0_g2_i2.p1  ORF type:complete len:142 (-),score=20.24 TRINITY_DN2505_c0_g2_i2:189-614(-)